MLPAVLNSRIHRGCPRLIPSSVCSHCTTASLSLDSLDTSVSRSSPLHAFHLSAPPDNKSRFQCSVTQSRSRSSVKQQSRLRYQVVNVYEMGRDIHTRVLRSEKGCKICVTHVQTRSDCVHTRDGTVRLNYASRFVRVIHRSHIVSIELRTMTKLQLKC